MQVNNTNIHLYIIITVCIIITDRQCTQCLQQFQDVCRVTVIIMQEHQERDCEREALQLQFDGKRERGARDQAVGCQTSGLCLEHGAPATRSLLILEISAPRSLGCHVRSICINISQQQLVADFREAKFKRVKEKEREFDPIDLLLHCIAM